MSCRSYTVDTFKVITEERKARRLRHVTNSMAIYLDADTDLGRLYIRHVADRGIIDMKG